MSEFQGFTPNQFADSIGIAVAEEWAGKGIGKALMTESVRLAKKHGYRFKLLVLTSNYSLKIATRLGFELKAFTKYHEFEYNWIKPFTGADPEHEGVGFAVLDLEKFQKHSSIWAPGSPYKSCVQYVWIKLFQSLLEVLLCLCCIPPYRIYSINRRPRISAALESRNINKRRARTSAAPMIRRLFEYFTQKASSVVLVQW